MVVQEWWGIYPTICPGGEGVWDNHHCTTTPELFHNFTTYKHIDTLVKSESH
jgi:hypothetical protein